MLSVSQPDEEITSLAFVASELHRQKGNISAL